jgi:glutathione synthase/RimK-type ligase-like ATP-grasp enzyme
VSLRDGTLGLASDLGSDARLGWHSLHPTTHAQIRGVRLPFWEEVKALATRAHGLVEGRLILGWDVAIGEEGPLIIEGNRGPDMDLMQRFMEVGFCQNHRFGELIAHHLQARGYDGERVSASGATRSTAARGATGTSAR